MQMSEKAVISDERHLKCWPPPSWICIATRVGQGKMQLAAFDGPSSKTPL